MLMIPKRYLKWSGWALLVGAGALAARLFPKAAGLLVFLVLAIAVAYVVLPVKIWFLEVSFAYFHVVFATFGALLAFSKRLVAEA